MTPQNYDVSSVPVNQAGDTFPSFYGRAGSGTISLNSSDAVSGKSLQARLSSGYAQIQFNPYSDSTRGFAREYSVNPSGWLFNTYDRMRFWIRVPQNQLSNKSPGSLLRPHILMLTTEEIWPLSKGIDYGQAKHYSHSRC